MESFEATPPTSPINTNEHPKGTTILVLGILSLICCAWVGPIVWLMGNSALKEINEGVYSPTQSVTIGRILGMVATALIFVGIFVTVFFFIYLA